MALKSSSSSVVLLLLLGFHVCLAWPETCSYSGLTGFLANCAISSSTETVYYPQYVWGSLVNPSVPTPPSSEDFRDTSKDFFLAEKIKKGATFHVPPMFPADPTPRLFVRSTNKNVNEIINGIAELDPAWKDEAAYLRRFCAMENSTCLSSQRDIVSYARARVPGFTKELHIAGTSGVIQVGNITKFIDNEATVACHDTWYAAKIFACHTLANFTLYRSSSPNAFIACHSDTTIWPPSHPAFKILGVPYGTPNICHHTNEQAILFA